MWYDEVQEMVVGLFLRNIKTYQGINYIPISDVESFCSLVGANGIGKSSVLEALDCFFNGRIWNYNNIVKKSGFKTTKPHIVPVFLVKKEDIENDEVKDNAEKIDLVAKKFAKSDAANASLAKATEEFVRHRERLHRYIDMNEHYLIPVGLDSDNNISVSILNGKRLAEEYFPEDKSKKVNLDPEHLRSFSNLLNFFRKEIDYIYIPREIDPETFTQLETNEIQALMGETLHQVLSREVPDTKIREINKSLDGFIDSLSNELGGYSYRTPGARQQKLKKFDLYQLIIQAFFNIRKLHKSSGNNWLEISQLSSGEKQKAIIDVAHSFLKKHRDNTNNLILAIDEPESSLHMSSCYDQFDALYEISKDCRQILLSTHWYGFFPTVDSGNATIITHKDGEHRFDILNLASYREEIKQSTKASKGKLPYDIRLKSVNDLIQSIITSSIGEEPYSWLICEGSSEKLYFEKYFSKQIESGKLRVVPVGGAGEIKKIYNHLATSYEDFKSEITGKIALVSDTDSELVDYYVKEFPNLICKRLVNHEQKEKTELVKIDSNPKSPKTEIEDCLNGKVFFEALLELDTKDIPSLAFLYEMETPSEEAAYFALNLRRNESFAIAAFLDTDDNKYHLANLYISMLKEEHKVPSWIEELRKWFDQ